MKPVNSIPESSGKMDDRRDTDRKIDIFEGSIIRTTLKMSIPLMISQLLTFAYVIVDTIFIAMIDKQSTALVSGTGLVMPLYFLLVNLATGLFIGISSLIARNIGENNKASQDKTAVSALAIMLSAAVLTLVLGYGFGDSLIHFLAGSELEEQTIQYGVDFFNYLLPGMALLFISYAFAGILQGEGLMKYLGISILISTVLNIILDPIFIFSFDLGVKGAALATSISIGLTILYFIAIFACKKSTIPIHWNIFKAQKVKIKEIMKVGLPASLGLISLSVSTLIINNIVSSISQGAMNSWVLVSRTDQLLLIPASAIAGVTIAMIGQNFGRGNYRRTSQVFSVHIFLSIIICLVLASLYALFATGIFGLFSSSVEVVSGSVEQVRLLAFTTIWASVSTVISASFQATGRPLPDLILIFVRMGLISIPLILVLVNIYGMGMYGVYLGVGIGNVLSFILSLLWGRSHIRKIRLKEQITQV